MRTSPLALAVAIVFECGSAAFVSAEQVIDTLPFTIAAGLPPGREPRQVGETFLPDLPFAADRGYGYVGGLPGLRTDGLAFGSDPAWPLTWREGVEKYVVRVPRGEYLVELAFLETEVAGPGLRIFDVLLEEQPVFPGLDLAGIAGDHQWIVLASRVQVLDGWLDVRFSAVTGDRPPRLSRLRVDRAAGPPVPPLEPVELVARSSLGQVLLSWKPPPGPRPAGYGVFRAESEAGPFLPITDRPTPLLAHADRNVVPNRAYHYRVCAHGAGGEQGAFTNTVSASARSPQDAGLRVYELRLGDDELRRLAVRRDDGVEALGELVVQGRTYYVQVRADARPEAWQRKKSYWITPQRDRNRSVLRRRSLYLAANPGDATAIREQVAATALGLTGLATPSVEPVARLLNGVYQGLYHDVEALDRRFRSRVRLDRVGLLALDTRGDRLRADWAPHGEQRGEEGNLMSLTELVHELNRIEQGEAERYFEERFYLDRLIDRWAFQVLRGSPHRFASGRYLLKDSRNGKWELFEDRQPPGAFGIADWSVEPRLLTETETLGVLLGDSLEASATRGGEVSVLETRFLFEPRLRERLCARIEELAAGALAPDKLDPLVEAAFARVREAALADPARWPDDNGAAFLGGPQRLQRAYRVHLETVRRALAAARQPRRPALRLNELVAADGDEAWVEIHGNGEAEERSDAYFLTSALTPLAPAATLPVGRLVAPGGLVVLRPADLRVAPAGEGEEPFRLPGGGGGILALWRGKPAGPRELCDLLVTGAMLPGGSYGRQVDGSWRLLAAATPGAANAAEVRRAPPRDLRHGVTLAKSGDVTIWLKARDAEPAGSAGAARVTLAYREAAGAAAFEQVQLEWNASNFQHQITLAANPSRRRTAYYFTVASEDGAERRYPLPAPDLTFFLPERPGVKINEVLPRPTRVPGAAGEYIELYNPGPEPVDLEGCFFTDSSRNPTRWRIPAGYPVPAKGFQVFYADGLNRGNHAGFKLSNSGEYLGLFGRMEEGNLLIDNVAFRGVKTGESWGATPDGSRSFRAWKDPTPGKRNIPKIPEEYLRKRQADAGAPPAEPPPAVVEPVEPPEPVEEPEDEPEDEG